jgi:hypothetical protein
MSTGQWWNDIVKGKLKYSVNKLPEMFVWKVFHLISVREAKHQCTSKLAHQIMQSVLHFCPIWSRIGIVIKFNNSHPCVFKVSTITAWAPQKALFALWRTHRIDKCCKCIQDSFLGVLANMGKATISFVISVRMSVRPHETTRLSLDEYREPLLKSVDRIQVWLKLDNNFRHFQRKFK